MTKLKISEKRQKKIRQKSKVNQRKIVTNGEEGRFFALGHFVISHERQI